MHNLAEIEEKTGKEFGEKTDGKKFVFSTKKKGNSKWNLECKEWKVRERLKVKGRKSREIESWEGEKRRPKAREG